VIQPRRDMGNGADKEFPSTYRLVQPPDGVHQHDAFDPAVKQFPRAMRPGEPLFDDAATGQRWRAARRTAIEHLVALMARSPWSEHLVLRGSMLLRAWLGEAARDPGDVDWVVRPLTMMLDDRRTARMIDGLIGLVRDNPQASAQVLVGPEVAAENIWTYERAPGRRLVFEWSTLDAPNGTVQVDFAFNERLPLPAAPTTILRSDGNAVTVWAAGPALSLAWKILWLETDFYPQGKDLYDATLLAERTYLPLDLLHEVLSKELGADAEAFTADRVLAWSVDWENFLVEYPWVRGSSSDWQARLHRALQGTFGRG
jgi:hypothetical protein